MNSLSPFSVSFYYRTQERFKEIDSIDTDDVGWNPCNPCHYLLCPYPFEFLIEMGDVLATNEETQNEGNNQQKHVFPFNKFHSVCPSHQAMEPWLVRSIDRETSKFTLIWKGGIVIKTCTCREYGRRDSISLRSALSKCVCLLTACLILPNYNFIWQPD